MKPFQLHDYTFQEILLLKSMAKFPNDAEFAAGLINEGQGEYNWNRLNKMAEKFLMNEICQFKIPLKENVEGKVGIIFKDNIQEVILNSPNPIPDNIRRNIDTGSILEKLPCSNLNLSEINYILSLIKNDIVSQS